MAPKLHNIELQTEEFLVPQTFPSAHHAYPAGPFAQQHVLPLSRLHPYLQNFSAPWPTVRHHVDGSRSEEELHGGVRNERSTEKDKWNIFGIVFLLLISCLNRNSAYSIYRLAIRAGHHTNLAIKPNKLPQSHDYSPTVNLFYISLLVTLSVLIAPPPRLQTLLFETC